MTEQSFYKRMEVPTYINAHDTLTIYGGSRMSDETLAAMREASRSFVDIAQLQRILGERIAKMTHNEGAYLTNGAAGGLLLAAAVCMVKGDMYHYRRLPCTQGIANEIIVMRAQHNAYDVALKASGATIVEIGDADETLEYELEGVINPNTAALFYFAPVHFQRASMPLQRAIEICHSRGVPVVVDAAAQLPPAENLWRYTEMGADIAIFSGGKTLCGPQDSGLMVGRADLIDDCRRFGAPVHGICRASKTSREAMAGLYVAIEQFLRRDEEAIQSFYDEFCKRLQSVLEEGGVKAERIAHGSVGQTYPRVFGYCESLAAAQEIQRRMHEKQIFIGVEKQLNAITLSPQNVSKEECETVAAALSEVIAQREEPSR